MLLNKPFDTITQADLQALVADGVPEGKTIEYKKSLPGNSYDEKKEFLADVSSFANASGGYLIFGIEANGGVPVKVCGLQNADPDAEILRLENMLRDNIEPRIPGVAMRSISLEVSNIAILVRVPRSWAQPHVVKIERHWRFYSRNSAGKYPLDVSELRGHVLLSGTAAERIRQFRADRLGKVVADETPVILAEGAKTVFHIIPLGAFDLTFSADVTSLEDDVWRFRPIGIPKVDQWRYNLDGLLAYGCYLDNPPVVRSYIQIFRNGCIEAVEASMLRKKDGPPVILSGQFEKELIDALRRLLPIQEKLGVEPPLFVTVSLLGVRDYLVKPAGADSNYPFWLLDRANFIDRDTLVLSEVMLDTFEADPTSTMRPIFDAIWNASGWPRSLNYDDKGRWLDR